MNTSCQKQQMHREYYLRMSKYFQHPPNIHQRVYEHQVALESIFTRGIIAYGTVRVNNCSFHKRVFVQFTIDQWKTFSVLNAYYSMHYSENNTDSFQFKLTVPKDKLLILSSQNSKSLSSILPMTVSFAICYCANGQEFWDNNYSRNYSLEILESTYKETHLQLGPSSITETTLHDDALRRQIAQEYHAVSNPSRQEGNICGLKNLGGTCYMNSVLQSLSFTSSLTNYFLSDEYTKSINMKNVLIPNGIVANEYWNLLFLLCCGQYSNLTPAPFKQVIGHLQHVYLANHQQDAHEFLIFLLDYLHRDLNRTKTVATLNENKEIDYSIIADLFYGIYRSIITCLECTYVSHSFDPFVCLTLPIPQTNQCTLEDCLSQLNEDEYLLDDSRWFCPKCKCLRNAKKRLEIHKLPKILIIQLKRFQVNSEMEWIKNDTLVFCPEDDLDLHQCCSSQQSSYILYSIINHNGSLNDGHYTTFCRNVPTKQQQWFECDDETIKSLHTDKSYLTAKAYLLFYVEKEIPEPTDSSLKNRF